jgi:hypothetical protein
VEEAAEKLTSWSTVALERLFMDLYQVGVRGWGVTGSEKAERDGRGAERDGKERWGLA